METLHIGQPTETNVLIVKNKQRDLIRRISSRSVNIGVSESLPESRDNNSLIQTYVYIKETQQDQD